MNLRILDIRDGVVDYKVDGQTRRTTIPPKTRDITAHLLKLEGYDVPADKPASKPKGKAKRTED